MLFVCVKNGGKSQMAAGLMRKIAGDTVTVDSAGTQPGTTINALSAQTLLEVGVDITDNTPKQLTDDHSSAHPTGSSSSAATPTCTPPTTHPSNTGTPTNPPTAESTASTACAWSATTSHVEFNSSPSKSATHQTPEVEPRPAAADDDRHPGGLPGCVH